jgi:hypothetical protein
MANPANQNDLVKGQHAKNAQAYVGKAQEALGKWKVQDAWVFYYKAELLQYYLKSPEEVNAKAGKLLFESTAVLDAGAKQNVRRLIGKDAGNGSWNLQTPVNPENVIQAREIVQGYYNTKFIYLGLTMQLLTILAFIVAVLSAVVAISLAKVPSAVVDAPDSLVFWVTIGLLGGIGGAISGLLGIKQSFAVEGDMPERVLNKWITIAKPILGFGAAIIIAIFVFAGFIQIADIQVSTYLVYALAFISGFSERLIIGAVSSRLPS